MSFARVKAPPVATSAVIVNSGMNTIGDARIGIRNAIG